VGYISPQIPDMGVVVHRRPAAVKAHLAVLQRHKRFNFAAQSIEKSEWHINPYIHIHAAIWPHFIPIKESFRSLVYPEIGRQEKGPVLTTG
jgi:hypothetical protein